MLVVCILNLNVGCVYTKPKCWLCVYYRITGCSDQIFPTRVLTLIKLFHKLSHLDLYKGISSFGGGYQPKSSDIQIRGGYQALGGY